MTTAVVNSLVMLATKYGASTLAAPPALAKSRPRLGCRTASRTLTVLGLASSRSIND